MSFMKFYEFILRLFGKKTDNHAELNERYDLLCRAINQDSINLDEHIIKYFDTLNHLINQDLTMLARRASPNNIVDILNNFKMGMVQFQQFAEFPIIHEKNIVAIGGKFSAGKSSFINTLIGKKQLTVEIDPTTSLPTYIFKDIEQNIGAMNYLDRKIKLSAEEFASLTHEEKTKYGSQIGTLLSSVYIGDPDFVWENIALLDTPGYTKPDEHNYNQRTDADISRAQMNIAKLVIWLVSAEDGGIKKDDLVFLKSIDLKIPKMILITKSDKKTSNEIKDIIELSKKTLLDNNLEVIDVIAVSRRIKDYPLDKVNDILNYYNKPLANNNNFGRLFSEGFQEYETYVADKISQLNEQIRNLNSLILYCENADTANESRPILLGLQNELENFECIRVELRKIKEMFFENYKSIIDSEIPTN